MCVCVCVCLCVRVRVCACECEVFCSRQTKTTCLTQAMSSHVSVILQKTCVRCTHVRPKSPLDFGERPASSARPRPGRSRGRWVCPGRAAQDYQQTHFQSAGPIVPVTLVMVLFTAEKSLLCCVPIGVCVCVLCGGGRWFDQHQAPRPAGGGRDAEGR